MVTIIIPYQKSCPERERNFRFLIANLKALRIPCIVAEQVPEWELDPSASVSDRNIQSVYLPHNGLFQKSKLINLAAKECESKYIWLLDADVFLDFQYILKNIKNQDIIRPFNFIEHLGEEKTKAYTSPPDSGFGKLEDYPPIARSDYYGKYSVILKKEIFDSVGGLNEDFEGWGWEDIDFIHNRLNKLNLKVDVMEKSGVHLYHPDAPRTNERRNYFLYRKNFNGANKKLSFCIHVKNRLYQLKETLKKNLDDNRGSQKDIEFILMDMNSSDFMSEWVISNFAKDIESGYLNLYRVLDFPFWHASIAKNTSHYYGEGDILVNLDCDNFTGKDGGKLLIDSFEKNDIVAFHQFCESDWLDGSYGRISFKREVFHELGGYDESFHNMGYQDTDIIERVRLQYPNKVSVNTDPKYRQAVPNDKEKSIENVPPKIKANGFMWMHEENKEKSQENIKNKQLVANNQMYGLRENVRVYDTKLNQFKKI
jgi:predicted glycosyltransferase involved in capsule biosynthesis